MTYIWNRAERVPSKAMPNVLNECFVRWERQKLSEILNSTDEKKTQKILSTISKQRNNLTEAVDKFNRNLVG
jgi:hypothetical protein